MIRTPGHRTSCGGPVDGSLASTCCRHLARGVLEAGIARVHKCASVVPVAMRRSSIVQVCAIVLAIYVRILGVLHIITQSASMNEQNLILEVHTARDITIEAFLWVRGREASKAMSYHIRFVSLMTTWHIDHRASRVIVQHIRLVLRAD